MEKLPNGYYRAPQIPSGSEAQWLPALRLRMDPDAVTVVEGKIAAGDPLIMAAINVFLADGDGDDLCDTIVRALRVEDMPLQSVPAPSFAAFQTPPRIAPAVVATPPRYSDPRVFATGTVVPQARSQSELAAHSREAVAAVQRAAAGSPPAPAGPWTWGPAQDPEPVEVEVPSFEEDADEPPAEDAGFEDGPPPAHDDERRAGEASPTQPPRDFEPTWKIAFPAYAYRVLKQMYAAIGISHRAMSIVDSLLNDTCRLLVETTIRMQTKATWESGIALTADLVEGAVQRALPPTMAKHACQEGRRALGRYIKSTGTTGSRTTLAGLVFPVSTMHKYIWSVAQWMAADYGLVRSAGVDAAVFLAASMELIAAEVLENAGHACERTGGRRITPRHLQDATREEPELKELMMRTLAQGGPVPTIRVK